MTAADYDRFTFIVPTDARLPNSGGTLTAFDLKPTGCRATSNRSSRAPTTTASMTEHFDGVNITVQGAAAERTRGSGRHRPGPQVTDDCDIVDDLPEMLQAAAG